jgi:ABC-2 type transport system permease protein
MLLIASAVFLQPILLAPNGTLARVMGLLPFSAPIAMPLRMAATSVPTWEIAAALVSVAAGCAAALWIAARIYRVGLLMYGKRPGLGEVLRWIRTA